MSSAAVKIGDTFGALFIGALVTMTIYGITTLQAYLYFMSFPNDDLWTKLLVATIWILDTTHAIFMCHALHHYLISHFGDAAALVDGTWTLFCSIAINVVMAFIVQCFFTLKIFQICPPQRRWWICGVIGFMVLTHFVFGLETVVFLFIKKQFHRLKEVSLTSAVPFGITAILSDIMIATTLCLLLDNSRSIFEDTNSIIDRLIIFAINRCILTSAMAIIETIVFSILPNSFYSVAIDFVIGKLYANSLLAVLNSRATLRQSRTRADCTELSTSFRVASAVTDCQTTGIQVLPREITRDESSSDSEKGIREIITDSSAFELESGKKGRSLRVDI